MTGHCEHCYEDCRGGDTSEYGFTIIHSGSAFDHTVAQWHDICPLCTFPEGWIRCSLCDNKIVFLSKLLEPRYNFKIYCSSHLDNETETT